MDRLESLAVFVAVAEQGSFVAAARKLGRSPAAITRAIAALEDRLAAQLLTRTTRAVGLTEAGQRYLDQGRRALAEFAELDGAASLAGAGPTGHLTLTAPEMFGRMHILPVALDFMAEFPAIDVTLLLLNRVVAFIDEGVDLGVRIAHLPDSTLRAVAIGRLRRVLCASPAYLAAAGEPLHPDDLSRHRIIAHANDGAPTDRWAFGTGAAAAIIRVKPRLVVNSIQAALDAAIAGAGLVRLLSYQTEMLEAAGVLCPVLIDDEPPMVPIQLVYPAGRYLPLKTRLFIDRAVAALRGRFENTG